MRFPVNVWIPGFKPRHSQDNLMASQSYYHEFYVFWFVKKKHAGGCLPLALDSTSFVEGAINIKSLYWLGHSFQGEICKG